MSTVSDWTGVEPLPQGRTTLLQASAGTGKTWQIEGLVVRLVAEYLVPIDRILVITFTNAATAELRDRIRRRLVRARDALELPVEPAGDPIVLHLWSDAARRDDRRARLTAALSSFDLAPISTIHGFSQRMLDQLAFESGQEPGLELMTDPSPVLARLVDDEVARVYAVASAEELDLLADMGWGREQLTRLAWAMTKAVEPVLEPLPDYRESSEGSPLTPVGAWLDAKSTLLTWLASDDGRSAIEALSDELARTRGKRLKGMRASVIGDDLDGLTDWLRGTGMWSSRAGSSRAPAWTRNLLPSALQNAWTGTDDELHSFEGRVLFERIGALFEEQDRLWPQPLVSFAGRVRGRVSDELVVGGRLTYSSMLSRLAERIVAQREGRGLDGPLARAIRARFDVALVDEFQDTDGAQWPVIEAVFRHPARRLLIIGDPKQAIYAFRGADVHVYLDAARVADRAATMRTNWRSDHGFIEAMNHVWWEGSDAFDLRDVDYVEVGSSAREHAAGIRGLPAQGARARRPFELRWLDGETLETGGRLVTSKGVGQDGAARLAALEAARLLGGGTELSRATGQGSDVAWRRLEPGDIAVLVRTNQQAERVRQHLEGLGIPSVSAGRGSVLSSPALHWICSWLDAVADPARDRLARALATTPLFGWTADKLADALVTVDDRSRQDGPAREAARRWERWLGSIRGWADAWSGRGFVRVFEAALDEFDVVRRLLSARQGERYATDLRHLVELCHAEERRTRIGPSGLAGWLRAAGSSASEGSDDAQALRLESDARAVQLVTIHKSKGLEYPVVLLPFGWADFQPSAGRGPVEYHREVDGRTTVRLNLEMPGGIGRSRAIEQAASETRQEQLRLLYVALTRARHHCVAWLGPLGKAGADTGSHALGRIVLRERDADGRPVPGERCPRFPTSGFRGADKAEQAARAHDLVWGEVQRRLDRLADSSGQTVGWSTEPPPEVPEPLVLQGEPTAELAARAWPRDRSLRSPWQVSSYSSMVAGRTFDAEEPQRAHESAPPGGPALDEDLDDGLQVELAEPFPSAAGLDAPIDTSELAGGTEVGTWAHTVLENLDFQRCLGRDGRELLTLLSDLGARCGVRDPRQHELLAAALPTVLDTPLDGGPTRLPTGFSLRDLQASDRLDELGFDLKLGDGNRWRGGPGARPGRVNDEGARLALESRLGERRWGGDEWLRAVLDRSRLEDRPVLPRIAGILTGFVDLTFRTELTGGGHRYYVCDYKTNRIGPIGQRWDSRWYHYAQPWMAWEMAHHGYYLQALLYTVALHRTLRQRLPGYRYDTHIGGHLYLFLRGMAGPEAPRDGGLALGVHSDRWPASVVLGLDSALCGASTDTVREIIAASAEMGGSA